MNDLNTKAVFEGNAYKACGINGVGREICYIISNCKWNIYFFNYINLDW